MEQQPFTTDDVALGQSMNAMFQAVDIETLEASPIVAKPRDLRKVIPPGKGRFAQGEEGTQEYLRRIRRGQTCGMKSMLALVGKEDTNDLRKPSVVCIVGGGPSLQSEVGALRHLVKRGAKTFAVNKSHDWLLKRGLPCDYAALLDPKDWVADYIDLNLARSKETRRKAGKLWVEPKYLIASQCHDDTVNKFKDHPNAYLWHAAAGLGEKEVLNQEFKGQHWVSIAGASVIGLRAPGMCHGLGFREMHLFGLDGSTKMTNGEHKLYAYDKPHTEKTWVPFNVELTSGWKRTFLSNHHMARSVFEFEDQMRDWDTMIKAERLDPFRVFVHGDPEHSAIAMIAAGMGIHADPVQNEKYGKPPE